MKRVLLLLVPILFLSGCDGLLGTSPVEVNLSGFESVRPLTELRLCLVRARFLKANVASANPAEDPANLSISLPEVQVSSGGTSLGTLFPGSGTFRRVELDLSDRCGQLRSLRVRNDDGTFSTDEAITLVFAGELVVGISGATATLNISELVTAMDGV